jgi:hypothetical protein
MQKKIPYDIVVRRLATGEEHARLIFAADESSPVNVRWCGRDTSSVRPSLRGNTENLKSYLARRHAP